MTIIRSLLFNIFGFCGTLIISVIGFPLLFIKEDWGRLNAKIWGVWMDFLLKVIVGIRVNVIGQENLPKGPFILASKHQSAWETYYYFKFFKTVTFVLKRELFRIPFFGWQLKGTGMIGVDRAAGASAIKHLIQQAKGALREDGPIVIFPEGSRSDPDKPGVYQPGIVALYRSLNIPVVPAALNSGVLWKRRGFLKYPGTITLQFLPPLQPGLSKEDFMKTLEEKIESACRNLPPALPIKGK